MNDGEPVETFVARRDRERAKHQNGNGMGTPLAMAAQMWPTPTGQDNDQLAGEYDNPKSGTTLGGAVRLWPTPRSITGGAETAERKQELGRTQSGGGDLQAAALWQTPASDSFRSRGGERKDEPGLDQQARSFPQDQPTATDGEQSSLNGPTLRRQLRPAFVEWLMGWPIGWTSLEPLDCASQATGSCPLRHRSHFERCGGN